MAQSLSLREQLRQLVRGHTVLRHAIVWGKEYDVLGVLLQLKPSPTSCAYKVLLRYAIGIRPHVVVIDPLPMRHVDGVPTPHLNIDSTLCLYDPNQNEWTESDSLGATIVPWTMRWLFHYEHWLNFGEWLGDATVESHAVEAGTVSASTSDST